MTAIRRGVRRLRAGVRVLPGLLTDERVREMYAGGHADATGRRYARLWAAVFALGIVPRRWVALEVIGRRSGRVTRFPLGMADVAGRWYLVSMLGERCNWVRNVRAADGRVVLWHGRAWPVQLVEVPVEARAPIIRRYLKTVPGGRPHIHVQPDAPISAIEEIAAAHPVFEVRARS